jgi:tetratricopeptide (TPR) repeat protein
VAVVLRAEADAARGAGRADRLEGLAAQLERSGDRAGAAEALADALEADPHRHGNWSWLLALAPPDALLARAAAARASAEVEIAFSDAPGDGGELALEEPAGPEAENASGQGVATPAAAVGEVRAPFVSMTSRDPAEYARDGRLRLEAGDLAGAYERLSVGLARDPSDLGITRDLMRVTERLGLFDEYVQLGEVCADAIGPHDPLAAAARFRHFAEVLRDRLGQIDRAGVMLEKALSLVPEDADTRRELVQIWTSRPETAPRALERWQDLARGDPADGAALAGIAEVCGHLASSGPAAEAGRAAERGRIAASMAAFASPAVRAAPAPGALARGISAELRARVAAPGATGPLARLLRLLAPWLEPLFPADLARRGASPSAPLGPGDAPELQAALAGAAGVLWARPHALLLSSRPGVALALENTQPPSIVATVELARLSPSSLAFVTARALDLLEHGWALAGKFAPADVGILLELACRFAGGSPPSRGLPEARAGAFLAALDAQVPAAARAAAQELGAPAALELADTDPRAFVAALRRTASRMALLYTGDPGPALHVLALLDRRLEAGPVDPGQALALPDLRDLALFALSDPFLELRAEALR